MRKIIRMVVVLTLITGLSGLTLAYVDKFTAKPIEDTKIKLVKAPAVQEVFEGLGADNDPIADRKKVVVGKDSHNRDITIFAFPAKKGGQVIAVALETIVTGYNPGLGVMTAIGTAGQNKGKIIRIGITSNAETPGKGSRASEPGFKGQFAGRSTGEAISPTSIDAISGATVTSQAVVEAINEAVKIFKANQEKLMS